MVNKPTRLIRAFMVRKLAVCSGVGSFIQILAYMKLAS